MRTQHSRVTEGVPEGVTLVDLSGKGQKTGQGAALAERTEQMEVARDILPKAQSIEAQRGWHRTRGPLGQSHHGLVSEHWDIANQAEEEKPGGQREL